MRVVKRKYVRVTGRQSAHYLYISVHITVTFAVRNCQSSEILCHVSVINVHFRNISIICVQYWSKKCEPKN